MEDSADKEVRVNRARRAILGGTESSALPSDALRILATLPAWWAKRAQDAGLAGNSTNVQFAIAGSSPVALSRTAHVAVRNELIEVTPETFGEEYVCALDSDVRAKTGRHYTPASLAAALWSQTAEMLGSLAPDGLVFDPAAGAAALLLPPLRAWLAANIELPPDEILAKVSGVVSGRDLDPVAVWIGSVLLAAELLPFWAQLPPHRRRPLPALLAVGDGLDECVRKARISILNPPYGRVRLDVADRARWSHALYGHANMYGLFMAAAVDATERGGIVSALVPTSWLGGAYFQRLRSTLALRAPLVKVTYVPERTGVFATGVLQETVLASFRVGGSSRAVTCERLQINGHYKRDVIAVTRLPTQTDRPWVLPRSLTDAALVRCAAEMPHRLADYGWRVSTGPLVWNRHKQRLSRAARQESIKVVWAADIDGGRLHTDPTRAAMRWCQIEDEDEQSFLVRNEPAVLVQRTTAPEQPRRVRAAILDEATLADWGGKVVVENHVNVLTCDSKTTLLKPHLLVALLDSEPIDRLYRCITGSVAVSAYELAALPLPGPSNLSEWTDLDDQTLAKEIDRVYSLPA